MLRRLTLASLFLASASLAPASTRITFTKSEVQTFGTYWIVDSRSLSTYANELYPARAGSTWQYSRPHSGVSADGDLHIDTAIDASGTGQSDTCCGSGDSPITVEITNATTSDRTHVNSLVSTSTRWDGVFRIRTEHTCSSCTDSGERKFEVHPATKFYTLSGGNYVLDTDYTSKVADVSDGRTHVQSSLTGVFTDTYSATVRADGTTIDFTFPSPNMNYAEYIGTVTQGTSNDGVSDYFLFHPTGGVTSSGNVTVTTSAVVKVRLVPGSPAATTFAALTTNSTLTLNCLTRIDMATISNSIAGLPANGTYSGTLPVELICLSLKSVTLGPTPTPSATPTASATPSASPSATPSATPSPTASNTPSATPSNTPSNTPTATPSDTPSPTPSGTPGQGDQWQLRE